MSNNFITHAFVSGEISPTLFGRTDLEKYDLGLAKAENFFVDYRGGISTRPGLEFIDFIEDDDQPIRFIPFRFAAEIEDTYLILLYAGGIRFIQDGAYVLEDGIEISNITQALPGVVTTSVAHGYSTGDWVKITDGSTMPELEGRTFQIFVDSATEFRLRNAFNQNFDTSGLAAFSGTGEVSRIYTIANPYNTDQFVELRAYQIRDTIRLTHKSRHIRNLTRNDHTDWTMSLENHGPELGFPTGVSVVADSAGSAEALFAVTAVNAEGEESAPSNIHLATGMVDYATTAGKATITWDVVPAAVEYRVYRSRLVDGNISKGEQLGFLGLAQGAMFVDNNIIPDFTETPPQFVDPFANEPITAVNVTNGGSGYAVGDTISISGGGGSGFRGTLIVDPSGGEIIGVNILDPGDDYSSPSATVTTAGGSGATFDIEVGLSTGRPPRVSTIFQQRQIYAASTSLPMVLWGSRPGLFSNFDVSRVLTDGDAFDFEIDSPLISPILHLVSNRLGLLLLTGSGIWLLSGGEERTVTPLNALAEPQTSTGAANVPPIVMDTDLLYLESHGRTVRLLGYDELRKAFKGKNVSILSNHLFQAGNQVTHWSFAQSPHSLVWVRRADGRFLSLTLDQEQNVFAWTPHSTQGLVEDVLALEEGNHDAVYFAVKRLVNGRWTKFIERLTPRTFDHVEDAFCVDCGLQTEDIFPARTLTPSAASGTGVSFTVDSSFFAAGSVGRVIRVGGGKGTIVTFVSGTEVLVDIDREITNVVPETSTPIPAESGEWSFNIPFSSVSGLDHLEGETVKILLDGQVIDDKTVSDGAIALGTTGTKAIVGLGFTATAKTLPPTALEAVIESRRKDVIGSAVRLHETKGLKVGADLDKLYEVKGALASMTGLARGIEHVLVAGDWNDQGQTFYVQDNPLPATILGLVLDVEIGDDTA